MNKTKNNHSKNQEGSKKRYKKRTVKQNTPGQLRVCTLSGTDMIGRNANIIEYGDEILIVDFGFGFPGVELPGIDYLIPNYKYLVKNKHKIKGILITHGHMDHMGGLSFVMDKLDYPPIYAGRFANKLIEGRLQEANMSEKSKLINVRRGESIKLGSFKAQFIGVTHSIPDAFSIFIESPKGNVLVTGDYKIDYDPVSEKETEYDRLKGLRGKVDLMLGESTNAPRDGKAKSGKEIGQNIEELIMAHDGRIVVAAFSSIISRLYSVIKSAQKANRKVVISGRSLTNSVKIARELRYIDIPDNVLVPEQSMHKYQDDQILFLCTGSQAERYGALNRISLGEHKYFKIKPKDKILLAASEIPTNITDIAQMTDRLVRKGADIVQNDMWDIHESGHGLKEDMQIYHDLVQPKAVMPVHGELTRRYKAKINYVDWGMDEEDVYLTDDGHTWIFDGRKWKQGPILESNPILVDGLGIDDIGDVVIKDRRQLSEYGMVCVALNLSSKNKKMIGRPRFVSRGFVYVKNSTELFKKLEDITVSTHKDWQNKAYKSKKYDTRDLIYQIEKALSKEVYNQTEREPMILVAIV